MEPVSRIRTYSWSGPVTPPHRIPGARTVFREDRDEGAPTRSTDDPNEARDILLQVYRTAAEEIVTLDRMAEGATSPKQRQALLELREIDGRRAELAQELLRAVRSIFSRAQHDPRGRYVDRSA